MRRFLQLWFVLASGWLVARVATSQIFAGTPGLTMEFGVQLAVVPLLQAAVLQSLAHRFHALMTPRNLDSDGKPRSEQGPGSGLET